MSWTQLIAYTAAWTGGEASGLKFRNLMMQMSQELMQQPLVKSSELLCKGKDHWHAQWAFFYTSSKPRSLSRPSRSCKVLLHKANWSLLRHGQKSLGQTCRLAFLADTLSLVSCFQSSWELTGSAAGIQLEKDVQHGLSTWFILCHATSFVQCLTQHVWYMWAQTHMDTVLLFLWSILPSNCRHQ